jgi:RimJ/RimL family protein N-acetyltransferase
MKFTPVTLEGKCVRLEPLSLQHKQGLCDAIRDGELWNLFVTLVPHPDAIDTFFTNAQVALENNEGLAFATIDKATNKVVGSTRFMKANLPNKRVEIGFTFLGTSWQKTHINTEAKLLMLTHAFETMALNRVELLTDFLNTTSRNAILRLGAKEEGILRNHMIMPDGRVRDSVIYSIISNEWAGVKQHLNAKLIAELKPNVKQFLHH